MTHADIIEALGGTGAVAEALSRTGRPASESTVSNWKHRSIPWQWRPAVARLAKERKVALPADFLVPLQ